MTAERLFPSLEAGSHWSSSLLPSAKAAAVSAKSFSSALRPRGTTCTQGTRGRGSALSPGDQRGCLCKGSLSLLPLCSPQCLVLPLAPHPAAKSSSLHGSPPAPWAQPRASVQAATEGSRGHQQSTSHLSEPSPHTRGFCYQLFCRGWQAAARCWAAVVISWCCCATSAFRSPLSCCFSPWAEENTQ